jgi:hypothetical protein
VWNITGMHRVIRAVEAAFGDNLVLYANYAKLINENEAFGSFVFSPLIT